MIEFLSGKIFRKFLPHIILDVNGVGYGVELTSSAFASLPAEGSTLGLWIFTRVKEDVLKLYGFLNLEERKVFDILLNVNGVGPKLALAILSAVNARQLKGAVERREPELLESVPGIGKRTAEKIILELHSKLEKFPLTESSDFRDSNLFTKNPSSEDYDVRKLQDLSSASENLGFKRKEFLPVLDKLLLSNSEDDFADLMRKALALLKPIEKSRSAKELDQLF